MKPLFEARGLRFSPRPDLTHEVDMLLHAGEALHLQGFSGSGKTTLLRILVRLRAAEAGVLKLQDRAASEVPATQWRRSVAYLPQRPVMLPGTVRDNLEASSLPCLVPRRRAPDDRHRLGGDTITERAHELLDRLDLQPRVLQQDAAQLSGGETARVALCRALLLQPRLILADELTSQLDGKRAERVVALVADSLAKDGALIVVCHEPNIWGAVLHQAKTLRLST